MQYLVQDMLLLCEPISECHLVSWSSVREAEVFRAAYVPADPLYLNRASKLCRGFLPGRVVVS